MRSTRYTMTVEFGDCDPAGIVFYPNYFRWIDASSRHFFAGCGVPPWRELEAATGVLGTPVVDARARFRKTASYGDTLVITTSVSEWRNRSFVMQHVVARDADTLVEATEVRIFARRVAGEGARIEAVAIPDLVRSRCIAQEPSFGTKP